MTTLYLIRHGEAEGNLYRRAQGQYDSCITSLGREQIRALAKRFENIQIDALWSSDLIRTQSTAAAILRCHPRLTLHTSPALREIDVGVWEDMPWGGIARSYPRELAYFDKDPAKWSVPGGEPFSAFTERIHQAVRSIGEAYDGKTVAIVSHGLAIRALLCRLLGISSENIQSLPHGDNTAVSLLTWDGSRLSVQWYNDASHLDGGLSTFSRQRFRRPTLPTGKVYYHFAPLDPREEAELYSHCYAETWQCSHGSLTGFSPIIYLRMAELHARQNPQCLVKLFQGETFAGLLELDPDRGSEDGAGWISLIYVEPALRGGRLGAQLIGHAVSLFRRQGREKLCLHVSATNEAALGFYLRMGFVKQSETQGVGGLLYLLEKDITRHVLTVADIFDKAEEK